MTVVSDIVDEVRGIIHDENETYRWADGELLKYVNAGLRQTVVLVPEANTDETVHDTLTNRKARQSIPTGGIKFVKVSRNYADDGTTEQGSVRYVEKDALDTFEPDWEYVSTKADGDNYFEHYCHDRREPTVFYLYPVPAADNKKVGIVYSTVPTFIAAASDTFPLADEYINPVVQYVVYRALTKESRETLPDAFRQELWDNYLGSLGLYRQATDLVTAKENRPPEDD